MRKDEEGRQPPRVRPPRSGTGREGPGRGDALQPGATLCPGSAASGLRGGSDCSVAKRQRRCLAPGQAEPPGGAELRAGRQLLGPRAETAGTMAPRARGSHDAHRPQSMGEGLAVSSLVPATYVHRTHSTYKHVSVQFTRVPLHAHNVNQVFTPRYSRCPACQARCQVLARPRDAWRLLGQGRGEPRTGAPRMSRAAGERPGRLPGGGGIRAELCGGRRSRWRSGRHRTGTPREDPSAVQPGQSRERDSTTGLASGLLGRKELGPVGGEGGSAVRTIPSCRGGGSTCPRVGRS